MASSRIACCKPGGIKSTVYICMDGVRPAIQKLFTLRSASSSMSGIPGRHSAASQIAEAARKLSRFVLVLFTAAVAAESPLGAFARAPRSVAPVATSPSPAGTVGMDLAAELGMRTCAGSAEGSCTPVVELQCVDSEGGAR
jgi:hypothetical protein